MATPEDVAAARRRRILAKGEDRLKLLRGEASHLPADDTPSKQPVSASTPASKPTGGKENDIGKILDAAFADVMKAEQVEAEQHVEAPKQAATSAAPAPVSASQKPESIASPAPKAAPPTLPATTPAQAVVPAPSVQPASTAASVSLLQRARILRTTGWIYTLRDVVSLLVPVLAGFACAYMALGCGWAAVPASSTQMSAWLPWAAAPAASKLDAAEAVRLEALSRLSGLDVPRPAGMMAGAGKMQALSMPLWVPFPEAVNGRCEDILATAQTARLPYAMLALGLWRFLLDWVCDSVVGSIGGTVRSGGGWIQGAVSLLSSLSGRPDGAGSMMLKVLPRVMRFSGAIQSGVRDVALALFTCVIALSIYAIAVGQIGAGSEDAETATEL